MAKRCQERQAGKGGLLRLPLVLRRDLVLALVAKLAALAILYALFFSPGHSPAIDPTAHIAGRLP